MFKKIWKKVKKSLGNQPTSRNVQAPLLGPSEPEIIYSAKLSKQIVSAAASGNDMAASTEVVRPAKSGGTCPSYAAKSVVGQRMTMEDSWQAVPDLLVVPKWWTCNARDHLPPAVTQPVKGACNPQAEQLHGTATAPAVTTNEASSSDSTGKAADASSPSPGSGQAVSRSALDPRQLAEKHGTEPVTVHFFAVYDGHGGSEVAKHCAKGLHEHLKAVVTASIKFDGTPTSGSLLSASTPAASPQGSTQETIEAAAAGDRAPAEMLTARVDGIEAALKAAFLHTDAQLAQTRSAHEVGTTAVVSLVTAPTLWIGNCGDSRALLCRDQEAVALSLDHKATRLDEVTRVEKAGGYVWWDRVMGELAVSRAIGDHCLRPYVIAEPEITSVVRRPVDKLLIMASDGLWDVFTNEDACTLALEKFHGELQRTSSSKMAVKKAASSLAKAALAKGSRDNVTVVVVDVRLQGTLAAGRNGVAVHSGNGPAAARSSAASKADRPSQGTSAPLPAPGDQQQPQPHVASVPVTPLASDMED